MARAWCLNCGWTGDTEECWEDPEDGLICPKCEMSEETMEIE